MKAFRLQGSFMIKPYMDKRIQFEKTESMANLNIPKFFFKKNFKILKKYIRLYSSSKFNINL